MFLAIPPSTCLSLSIIDLLSPFILSISLLNRLKIMMQISALE